MQDFALGKDVELDNIADATNYANGTLNFINWEVITNCGVTISDIFKDKSNTTTFTQDANNFASVVTNPTVGCTNDFEWTYYKNY